MTAADPPPQFTWVDTAVHVAMRPCLNKTNIWNLGQAELNKSEIVKKTLSTSAMGFGSQSKGL